MSLSLVLYDAEKARENALQELNILVSREKLSEALACCDELLESLDETNDLVLRCKLEQSRCLIYCRQNNKEKAGSCEQSMLICSHNLALQNEEYRYLVRNAMDLQADVQMMFDKPLLAMETVEKALEYSKLYDLGTNEEALLTGKYGLILCKVGNQTEGLQYQLKATQMLSDENYMPQLSLPLAQTLLTMGQYLGALECFAVSLRMKGFLFRDALIYDGMGECLANLTKSKEAFEMFEKSKKIYMQINNTQFLLKTLNNQVKVLLAMQKVDHARHLLREAQQISHQCKGQVLAELQVLVQIFEQNFDGHNITEE